MFMERLQSGDWSSEISEWQSCSSGQPGNDCSDEWAGESVVLACDYAYVDTEKNILKMVLN